MYKNEKLNIKIENEQYFDIIEKQNFVELKVDSVIKFIVYHNSKVTAYDASTVKAYSNSKVTAYDNSTVKSYDNSTVIPYDVSIVRAYDNSTVIAYDVSKVYAHHNSTVTAYDNSTVYAYHNSTVYSYHNSTVYAYSNSTVTCNEFSICYRKSVRAKITTNNHYGAVIEQVFKAKKKMVVYKKLQDDLICELELVKGQIFQSENHSKCRTDKAKVLKIESIDGTQQYQEGVSQYDKNFIYKVGETVSAQYDENIVECSRGIHFFLSRKGAENY